MALRGRKVWSFLLQAVGVAFAAGLLILALVMAEEEGHGEEIGGPGIVEPESHLFAALNGAVGQWRRALAAGDATGLTAFALPEYAVAARAALADPGSDLHRTLMAPDSALRRLAADRRTRVALFVNTTPYDPERGVSACLYDPAAVRAESDADLLRMLARPQGASLACQAFFDAAGGWRADYEAGSAAPEG
jgi:hypothetical protein